MRTSLFLVPLAAAGIVAGAAGVAVAADDAPVAAPPTTTIPAAADFEAVMQVLTPEQLVCIAQNMGTIDANDPMAAMAAMTQCGVTMDQLMQIATGDVTGTTATTVAGTGAVTGTPDAATITAVLGLIGLDATDLSCIASSMAVPPTDEGTAYNVLATCQISLAELLQGIVAANAGAAVGPATPTTVAPVGTTGSMGNTMADMLVQQFAAMGMTLTPEQGTCLADQITSQNLDLTSIASDQVALMNLLSSCNIQLTDLMGG